MTCKFLFAALAGAALLSITGAQAATRYIPVPPVSGAATGSTQVIGINDSNTITGSWYDSNNVEHGFVGTLTGTYTTFDYTDSANDITGTEPHNVNNHETVIGYAKTSNTNFIDGYIFERLRNGSLVTVNEGTTPLDGVGQGMLNATGQPISGSRFQCAASGGCSEGWTGEDGKWTRNLPLVFKSQTVKVRGMSKAGTYVGFFVGADQNFHGFILKDGKATQVDDPNPEAVQGTFLEGINDNGQVAGWWQDKNYNPHPFILDTTANTFRELVLNKTTRCGEAWNGNIANLVPINFWECATGTGGGAFIYCPNSASQCPSSANAIEVPDPPRIREPEGYFRPIMPGRGPRNPIWSPAQMRAFELRAQGQTRALLRRSE